MFDTSECICYIQATPVVLPDVARMAVKGDHVSGATLGGQPTEVDFLLQDMEPFTEVEASCSVSLL